MPGFFEAFSKFFPRIGNAVPRVATAGAYGFDDADIFPTSSASDPIKIGIDELRNAAAIATSFGGGGIYKGFDGEKFYGGFGATKFYQMDYWALRARSGQLFRENLYARGLIRRLVTNEINTGLSLVCSPNPDLIPLDDEQTSEWSEMVENRFALWGNTPALCDYQGMATFGEIQRTIRRESLIDGDILVVLRSNPATGLPAIELIRGEYVQTPVGATATGNISYGVELDSAGRQVAYHVTQADGSSVRIPAFGERSNRRIAWLAYGCERRFGEVRGEPLLSLMLQSLKEIDRYRDAAQRKAVVNSIIAMFIKKGEDKPGSRPMSAGGAMRRDSVSITDDDGSSRSFKVSSAGIPGIILDELQHGEEPVAFRPDGTDLNFPVFEGAVINAIAWANEVPSEILTLAFEKNYSASQAAINEFRIYLARVRNEFGEKNCSPVYGEWLLAEVMSRKIAAPNLLQAMNDPKQYDVAAAWFACEWPGAIKPSTDIVKQTNGYGNMVDRGWATNELASRELTGTKFRTNARRLTRENKLIADALRPRLELEREFGKPATDVAVAQAFPHLTAANIASAVADELEQRSA